jgi:predicted metal-dependent hydrolase
MSSLPVRRLHIDLATPFARRWNGNDAFRSAFMNALSLSFPFGEQFFIDSVKAGVQKLSPALREQFAEDVKGFVGQEATHRHLHGLFNKQLAEQGLSNLIERRAMRRTRATAHLDVRMHVAATAGAEHLTALFAHWLLQTPAALDNTEPRLQNFWLWHSAEETEHRSVAFDIYRALEGNEQHRRRIFKYVTFTFLLDLTLQTLLNLWHDRSLLSWST